MPNSSHVPRLDNPNAPEVKPQVNSDEEASFAGIIASAVTYGIVVILFFQCVETLTSPANRTTRGVRWPLLAHTMAMFSFVTVRTSMNLNLGLVSYIDSREFPGVNGLPPGPIGYREASYSLAANAIPTLMFLLNNWLADGLLLYRCHVIYLRSYWVIAIPCMTYIATLVEGIMLVRAQIADPNCTIWRSGPTNIGIPYSISVALNVLLTLMIVARLSKINRDIQGVMNAPLRIGGLYKALIAALTESSALYAVNFLLFIGTWAANNSFQYFFFPILSQVQVIAPFLITLRLANRRALKGATVSEDTDSINPSRERLMGSGISPGGHPSTSVDTDGKMPEELVVKVMTTVDLHRDDD